MRSGLLRHKVTFEELVIDRDSDGAVEEVWIDAFGFKISAEIMPLSGRELIAAQATQSKVTGRMKVRYREGFKPSMRVFYRGAYYNIEAVIPDIKSGKEYLTLLTSMGVNEG